jgi:uncharacterized membrane protein
MGMSIGVSSSDIGFMLVVSGFILVFIGMVMLSRGRGKGGGILLIGPIPIIWGSDRESLKWIALIFALLIFIYIVFSLFWLYRP